MFCINWILPYKFPLQSRITAIKLKCIAKLLSNLDILPYRLSELAHGENMTPRSKY